MNKKTMLIWIIGISTGWLIGDVLEGYIKSLIPLLLLIIALVINITMEENPSQIKK